MTPSEHIHHSLLPLSITLATAESCTGGLISAQLTSYAGSSQYFDRGFITYSNAAKQEMLGVSPDCLKAHGAVSYQTAEAMAEGALRNSQANISLSVTGIAGPSGGTSDKPVGTICFAWASTSGSTQSKIQHFAGSRTEVRRQAANFALTGLLHYLENQKLI